MKTSHRIVFDDSRNMDLIPSDSVHLIVTSPPYPMIEMWDAMFIRQDRKIRSALNNGDRLVAFELMHQVLDRVWRELHRVLVSGGIACINIGDATRSIRDEFSLYSNHSRILSSLLKIGFSVMPMILWRKPTNAPNKFMGSGMLPAGAYVTLEHEYILIVRKGPKREFKSARDKQNRRESALFWEERNQWYSDVWLGLIGTQQKLGKNASRLRSGAFPFELAYRLVNMYSAKGDTVVDPYLGTGTTMWSAIASGRNSIGYEIETGFREVTQAGKDNVISISNDRIHQRLEAHIAFVKTRRDEKGQIKYTNRHYKFPVMTRQETELFFNPLNEISQTDENSLEVDYLDLPGPEFVGDWQHLMPEDSDKSNSKQLKLF
jgi:DNA modification methylase